MAHFAVETGFSGESKKCGDRCHDIYSKYQKDAVGAKAQIPPA